MGKNKTAQPPSDLKLTAKKKEIGTKLNKIEEKLKFKKIDSVFIDDIKNIETRLFYINNENLGELEQDVNNLDTKVKQIVENIDSNVREIKGMQNTDHDRGWRYNTISKKRIRSLLYKIDRDFNYVIVQYQDSNILGKANFNLREKITLIKAIDLGYIKMDSITFDNRVIRSGNLTYASRMKYPIEKSGFEYLPQNSKFRQVANSRLFTVIALVGIVSALVFSFWGRIETTIDREAAKDKKVTVEISDEEVTNYLDSNLKKLEAFNKLLEENKELAEKNNELESEIAELRKSN